MARKWRRYVDLGIGFWWFVILLFLSGVAVLFFVFLGGVFFSDLGFGMYALKRILLVFLLGVLTVFSIIVCLENNISKFFLFSFVVFVFCIALTAFVSFSDGGYLWPEPGMYAFFVLAVVFASASLSGIRSSVLYAKCWAVSVAVSCFLYGGMSINVYLFALFDGVANIANYIPWGFVNIRYWSHLATWLLPLLPLAVLVGPLKERRLWRWGVTLGAGMWWWMVFLSTARGSMVAILAGSMLSMTLIGRAGFAWLKMLCFHILVGGGLWLVLSVIVPSIFLGDVHLRPIKLDASGRWPLFLEAWRMSLEDFPFGMGPQSWLTHGIMTEEYAASPKFAHPHNMYLMWAAEYGWLLVAVMVVIGVQAAIYLRRARNCAMSASDSQKLLLLTGFTASVVAALSHAAVSAVFIAPASMLVGLFVLIGFWALILPEPDQVRSCAVLSGRTIRLRRILAGGVVLVLAITWTVWAREVWIYYQDMREDEKTYYEAGNGGIQPRFWLHGNFPR